MKKLEAQKYLFSSIRTFDRPNDDQLWVPPASGELQVAKLSDQIAIPRDYRDDTPDSWIVEWLDEFQTGDAVSSEKLLKMMSVGLGELDNFVVPQAALNILYPLLMKDSIVRIWQQAREFIPAYAYFSMNQHGYYFQPEMEQQERSIGVPIVWSNFSMLTEGSENLPGPVMISFNHHVMANKEFSLDYKRTALALELFSYLIQYRCLVLAIPKRANGSLTHGLLNEYNPTIKDVTWENSKGEEKTQTLYFIALGDVPSELLNWYMHLNHPVVEHGRQSILLQRQQVSFYNPSDNLFDLSTKWASEYVEHVAHSVAHEAFLLEVIKGNDENFLSLLQPWIKYFSSLPDLHWSTWFLNNLDKEHPLQINLNIDTQQRQRLSREEKELFDSFL